MNYACEGYTNNSCGGEGRWFSSEQAKGLLKATSLCKYGQQAVNSICSTHTHIHQVMRAQRLH